MKRDANVIDETKILAVLGRNLRTAREMKDLKYADVAHLSGYDRQCLSQLEYGEQNVRYSSVMKLAKTLDVSFPTLFSRAFKVLPVREGASIPGYQEDDYLALFRTNFRRVLQKNNERQKNICARSGIPEASISRILRGDNNNPQVTTLYAMAESVHMELADLFKRS